MSTRYCEYRHCRSRLNTTDSPWRARIMVAVDDVVWQTCERCADYLTTEARCSGKLVSRTPIADSQETSGRDRPASSRRARTAALARSVGPEAKTTRRKPAETATQASIVEVARALRKTPTKAETLLWGHLSQKRLDGWKFRRHAARGSSILTFYCPAGRLVILLQDDDRQPSRFSPSLSAVRSLGLQVLTLRASGVQSDIASAKAAILEALAPRRGAP